MAKLYGLGAAVVIVGALFKIIHLPGANEMLFVGLGTEALIFFFSAFEPPHVEPDWSLVYPQLSGLYGGKQIKTAKSTTQELDKMLSDAKVGPELIQSLGKGLNKLSENASQLGDLSNAAVATDQYTSNVSKAASSVGELSKHYQNAAKTMGEEVRHSEEYNQNMRAAAESAANLANSFQSDLNATESFSTSVQDAAASASGLAQSYQKSAAILNKSVEALDFEAVEGRAYNEQLQKISSNLSALNAVYELQLQGSNQTVEATGRLHETMENFLARLSTSAENTELFQKQLQDLNDNMASLNRVYGNMLSAMNVGR
ncbi:MAG: gliding motility protein GldL [Bacteroidales bacterium]